jgi:hypothetical protein
VLPVHLIDTATLPRCCGRSSVGGYHLLVVATYADAGLGQREVIGRRSTPWGELALAAVAGGIVVAAAFALFSGGGRNHQSAPPAEAGGTEAAARLRHLAAETQLSPREEAAVAAALGEARASGKAAMAYFEGLRDDDGRQGVDPQHAQEIEAIVEAVISSRLATEIDRRRLRAVERQLMPVVDWLALGTSDP